MPVIEPIITGAATIAAAGANAYSQGKTNRKTRAQNQYFFDRQREFALSDWDKQNTYNSPKMQMQRLREAGLNPALVYGQGATASDAGPVRNVEGHAPTLQAPQFDPDSIGQAIGNVYQTKTQGIQTSILQQTLENERKKGALMDAQTLHELASTDATAAGAGRTKFDLAVDTELRPYTLSTRKSGAHTASNIVDNTAMETKLKTQEYNNKFVQQKLANEFMQSSIAEKNQLVKKVEEEIKKLGLEQKLLQYEDNLHQSGTQKTDPFYYRLLLQLLGGTTSH